MSVEDLIRLYNLFRATTPVQLPNDHDFSHFMDWLERNYGSTE